MKSILPFALAFIAATAHAEDKRIVPTDALGHRQSHKPSYVLKDDGRILAEDAFGNTLSGRPRYKVKDGNVYQTDALGHVLRQVGKVEE